jgi:hypothetical protein
VNTLKKALFDEYDGFADKRIKKLESGATFIIDDRTSGDHGADKRLFGWFCSIFADVESSTEVTVRLIGGVPINSSIKKWAQNNSYVLVEGDYPSLTFSLQKSQIEKLLDLATLIEQIVAPGVRYSEAAYKYVCPRTANSLRRLHSSLCSVMGT